MKRITTLVMAIALAIPSFAQFDSDTGRSRYNHINTEHYYGLRIGLNIASMSSDDPQFDAGTRTGLAIGGVYGIKLSNSTPLWLEPGVMYSEKGGETTIENEKVTYRLSYLQLPIVIKYSINIDDDFYVQPFFGGYLALGVGGKAKYYNTRESDAIFDTMNRFDGGLRLGCGAEYKMIYAELGFDLGLADIAQNDFDATRTRSFFINIGVNF